jgi:GNAT superfamily N-acetyltransferase
MPDRSITVVSNEARYWDFIRRLRNDPRVQAGFIEVASISPEQQAEYMSRHGDRFVVGLADGVPAGFAGSIEGDIRVCVHPDFQGLGVGRVMIQELLRRFPGSRAKIKVENASSLALFRACGFVPEFVILAPPPSDRR